MVAEWVGHYRRDPPCCPLLRISAIRGRPPRSQAACEVLVQKPTMLRIRDFGSSQIDCLVM